VSQAAHYRFCIFDRLGILVGWDRLLSVRNPEIELNLADRLAYGDIYRIDVSVRW